MECQDGRLALSGLPADRETRLSLVLRLRELCSAVIHRMTWTGTGDGLLWQRYCRTAFAAWMREVTVEYAGAERD